MPASPSPSVAPGQVELSIVMPCLNEAENIAPIVKAVSARLGAKHMGTITYSHFALSSGIAGYMGMWVSIRANIRVAAAATKSAENGVSANVSSRRVPYARHNLSSII